MNVAAELLRFYINYSIYLRFENSQEIAIHLQQKRHDSTTCIQFLCITDYKNNLRQKKCTLLKEIPATFFGRSLSRQAKHRKATASGGATGEGNWILRNVGSYSPVHRASYPKRFLNNAAVIHSSVNCLNVIITDENQQKCTNDIYFLNLQHLHVFGRV